MEKSERKLENLWSWEMLLEIFGIGSSGKIKVLLYKTYCLLILTYGADTWAWTNRDVSRLRAIKVKCLWSIRK
jgi:hypothetical protein